MKKILTTLTVIAATALGAQAQVTNTNFITNGVLVNNFTNMTFNSNSITLPGGTNFTRARLAFAVTGVNFGDPEAPGDILFGGITLSGQGFTGTRSNFGTIVFTANTANPNDLSTYPFTAYQTNNFSVGTWTAASNLVNFRATFRNGAFAPNGAQLFYAVQYDDGTGFNVNSSAGNLAIVAVPEPSTYIAAIGLLGLCLWSARKHLFKLSGERSTSSSDSVNSVV